MLHDADFTFKAYSKNNALTYRSGTQLFKNAGPEFVGYGQDGVYNDNVIENKIKVRCNKWDGDYCAQPYISFPKNNIDSN